MPGARPRKTRVSYATIVVGFAVLILFVGIMAGAAWLIIYKLPQKPELEPLPVHKDLAGTLAKWTKARLFLPPLEQKGKLISYQSRPTSYGTFYSILWSGQTDTDLILAEQAIQDCWIELDPKIEVKVIYPDHSREGERVRMLASYFGKPLVEVLLLLENPEPEPEYNDPLPPERPPKPKAKIHTGRIAIIIDDIGNDLAVLDKLLSLGVPLTFSVLPYAEHTVEACQRLCRASAEVMLHMPMEPISYPRADPGPGALLLGMSPAQIRKALSEALAAVPMARGINNHMGSAFTADHQGMQVLLGLAKEKGLFYVDSRTSPETVAYSLAREMGVASAQRKIFLDHSPEQDKIRARVRDLAEAADEEGFAIGIGHPYPETISVLADMLPEMAAAGYKFVTASEMVE